MKYQFYLCKNIELFLCYLTNIIIYYDYYMDNTQEVTPWNVTTSNKFMKIDYHKLIEKFGCDPIDGSLIKRFEQVTNCKAHTWLRRGLFFSNKDLNKILDRYEKGLPIGIYTGRGSSSALHIGHLIPFMFTQWLQDVFSAVVVIQMSDDEKFFFKGTSEKKDVEHYNKLTYENAKDIIACGFDPDKTYIFSNYRSCGGDLYQNVVKISQTVTGNQIRGIYGLNLDDNMGKLMWPAFQCAPAFSNSFTSIFHKKGLFSEVQSKESFSEIYPDGTCDFTGKHIPMLIPMAIDQDPYFRMACDFADKYKKKGYIKPARIHAKFLVDLKGVNNKLSSSNSTTAIFLSDDLESIKRKIKKFAFSGGKETSELQMKFGGNLQFDVSYQWLTYFMDSDEELKNIAHAYRFGKMTSSEIKTTLSDEIVSIIKKHQEKVKLITPEILHKFFNKNREFDMSIKKREPIELESDENYNKYGINFDIYFGTDVLLSKETLEYETLLYKI